MQISMIFQSTGKFGMAAVGQKAKQNLAMALLAFALFVVMSAAAGSPATAQSFWADMLGNSRSSASTSSSLSENKCKAARKTFSIKWSAHQRALSKYWAIIEKKRKRRRAKMRRGKALRSSDYVMSHPPTYKGPRWPKCKLASDRVKKPKPKSRPSKPLPTVRHFLAAAKKIYGFEPRHTSERAYKANYARESLSAGLSAHQVVAVYALETGGIGPYARQSGIFITDQNCKPRKATGRAASTALGYAQLLAANSVAVVHLQGGLIADKLARRARREATGGHAIALQLKSQLVRRMRRDIARATRRYRNKNGWREYVSIGKTRLGHAAHALNLDADIGPMLQVYKLLRIKKAAAKKGFHRVSGAQMELMNLVGYGRGLEMMHRTAANAASANFFSRKGYYRNPLAKNQTARGLLAKIDKIIARQMKKCGSIEFLRAFQMASR